jgi:hypothetical protein
LAKKDKKSTGRPSRSERGVVQLNADVDLYLKNEFSGVVGSQGLTMREVLEDLMRDYIKGSKERGPFGELSTTERRYVRLLLRFLREEKYADFIMKYLSSLES